jgi:hypothetical protein
VAAAACETLARYQETLMRYQVAEHPFSVRELRNAAGRFPVAAKECWCCHDRAR